MNYIRHLTGFFDRVAQEDRLNPTHISLYMALFQFWNINRFINPISISRSEMMSVSKICAKATYHKVIKDLHEFGFIQYKPSYNPFKGSAVYLMNFETSEVQNVNGMHTKRRTRAEQAVNSNHTKIETSTEPMNEPYINNTNIINSKHSKQQAHDDTSSDFDKPKNAEEKKKSSAKRKSEGPVPLPESPEEVKTFFAQQNSSTIEAEKFFNHFQSNGWKVGGRSPMKDWQAAARNWILNINKFEPRKNQSLHTTALKDYGEPL